MRFSIINRFVILAVFFVSPAMAQNATGVSQRVADALALCSAGITISQTVRGELTAELTRILTAAGGADAEGQIESAVKGIAFGDQDLTNANVLESQRIYSNCVSTNLQALQ